jgi:uncharacterized protein (TIGR00299 family) protein
MQQEEFKMIAYFDMFSGISGDMALGALIDLGVPENWLQDELSGVLDGFLLKTSIVEKNFLQATDVVIESIEDDSMSRNYSDIKALIQKSSLSDTVKKNSLAAFEKIAEAESKIHGKEIETVHFHEIGGIDSIIDIIGSFLCVEYLGINKVYASKVPLGTGFLDCAHGKIPVPVPATIAILKDTPVKSSDATTEIVTPTGAAIICTLVENKTNFGPMPEMFVKNTGYGSGKRDTGSQFPNLLRIITGEEIDDQIGEDSAIQKESIQVVKTNVDDMSPEVSGFLMETLFENQALDVCFIPVQMKKNRPGIQIEVMCRKDDLNDIITLILTQTTSIGVRYHECNRSYLLREKAFIETTFGRLQAKKITNPDKTFRFVPEYDVAKKVALENNIPLKDVYNQILCDANPIDPMLLEESGWSDLLDRD